MDHLEAIELIKTLDIQSPGSKHWIDLGSGAGTFTLALADLLPERSVILAMDKNKSSLESIPDRVGTISIHKQVGDFVDDPWPDQLDGILMANALHFVKDKDSIVDKAFKALKPNGYFLLVEYEMETPNTWVPYPEKFATLTSLFTKAGFASARKLRERPSAYNKAMMYAAIFQK